MMITNRISELKSDRKIKELDEKAVSIATRYNALGAELLSVLQELDKYRGYLDFGSNSLFDYCVNRLKLSEGAAKNFIVVSRTAEKFPDLKKAIEAGEITISKARKIAPVLTKENSQTWIDLAKTNSSREIEKAVATEQPELLIQESAKFKAADRIELKLGISEKVLKKLERIKDLESQRTAKAASFEDVVSQMAELYLEKCDPIRKAERAIVRAEKKKVEPQSDLSGENKEAAISVEVQVTPSDSKRVPGHDFGASVSKPKIERAEKPIQS